MSYFTLVFLNEYMFVLLLKQMGNFKSISKLQYRYTSSTAVYDIKKRGCLEERTPVACSQEVSAETELLAQSLRCPLPPGYSSHCILMFTLVLKGLLQLFCALSPR